MISANKLRSQQLYFIIFIIRALPSLSGHSQKNQIKVTFSPQ